MSLKLKGKPNHVKTGKRKKYEREELLEALNIYTQENQRVPTATDFRRGFLPNYNLYVRKFGNIENARNLAGVYNIVSRETMRGIKK